MIRAKKLAHTLKMGIDALRLAMNRIQALEMELAAEKRRADEFSWAYQAVWSALENGFPKKDYLYWINKARDHVAIQNLEDELRVPPEMARRKMTI